MSLTKADFSRLRSLQEKKHRESLGLFVVEGEKVIAELLSAQFSFTAIYTTKDWTGAARPPQSSGKKTPPLLLPIEITPAEMARISHYPTPSTVLAVGQITRPLLSSDTLNHGLTLALDGLQDPGNVGTLLRIADWFAFDRVLLSPDCADLFSQKVINASMGSFARVKTFTTSLADALATATVPILGCDLHGANIHTLTPLRDAVVVLGSEGRGLSPAVQSLVTQRVTIPKFGAAESLNVAIAAAIVCDNLRRTSASL